MAVRKTLVAIALLSIACSSNEETKATPTSEAGPTSEEADAAVENDAGGPPIDSGSSPLAKRPYAKTVPSKYDATKPTPLVVLLHGYGASAKIQDDYFKMSALAEAETFLLALPDGTEDASGKKYWSATDACCDFLGQKMDDVGYISEVIQDMKQKHNVDAKRVYLVGHSNGGFMANAFACARANEVASFVSLAGANYLDPSKCNPSEPVAVLQVHGDTDDTVSYTGGSLFPGGPTIPSATATIATWAAKNGCDATLATTNETLDLVTNIAAAETTVARHQCTKGAAELWTIVGGGHIPTFQTTWAKTIYDWLMAHPKP